MSGTTGFLGDHLLVNGILGPYLEVTTTRIRLRLLNGSNARVYDFAFADGRPFAQIASDGGLLSTPHGTRHVQLAPGERAEIVVALTPGERVVLRSASPATGAGLVQRDGGADRFDVLELRAAPTLTDSPELPGHLAALPPLPAHTAVRTRTFELAEHHINGRKMDPRRIDARVGKDTTEIWEVRSGDGTLHTFHVHDVQFQVLSVDGRKPPPELSGWKDTVLLPPGDPDAAHHALRRLRRPPPALHVPLPHAVPRGPGNEAAVARVLADRSHLAQYGRQQVGPQRHQIGHIEGVTDVTTVPPGREQARAAQDSEVAGNLRGGKFPGVGQLTGGVRAAGQGAQQPQPYRMRECLQP